MSRRQIERTAGIGRTFRRLGCACLIAVTPSALAEDACMSLTHAAELAAARDPAALAVSGRRALAEAATQDARRWLGGSGPSIYGTWISDEASDTNGLREYEGGLSLPLRLPAEHQALGGEAEALRRFAMAAERSRRLDVAGQVRERFWTLAGHRVEADLARHEVEHLGELEALLAARVARGDAAPLDLDLARSGLAEARARLLMASGEADALLRDWRLVTGCADAPAPPEPAPPGAVDADHPREALALAALDAARARLAAERARPGQAPTVGVLFRRERGGAMAPWIDSLGVSVTVPIGRSGLRVRARGDAAAVAADAEATLARVRRELESARAMARSRLAAAGDALVAAREHRDLAERARDRAQRAWEAGAWDTSDLLRVEGTAAEARVAAELAAVTLGHAAARLDQALGELP